MKIKLYAFGSKMISAPMDVPEETGRWFTMVLTQPTTEFRDYHGTETRRKESFDVHCKFEWNGMFDFDDPGCRIYKLVDIQRIPFPIR